MDSNTLKDNSLNTFARQFVKTALDSKLCSAVSDLVLSYLYYEWKVSRTFELSRYYTKFEIARDAAKILFYRQNMDPKLYFIEPFSEESETNYESVASPDANRMIFDSVDASTLKVETRRYREFSDVDYEIKQLSENLALVDGTYLINTASDDRIIEIDNEDLCFPIAENRAIFLDSFELDFDTAKFNVYVKKFSDNSDLRSESTDSWLMLGTNLSDVEEITNYRDNDSVFQINDNAICIILNRLIYVISATKADICFQSAISKPYSTRVHKAGKNLLLGHDRDFENDAVHVFSFIKLKVVNEKVGDFQKVAKFYSDDECLSPIFRENCPYTCVIKRDFTKMYVFNFDTNSVYETNTNLEGLELSNLVILCKINSDNELIAVNWVSNTVNIKLYDFQTRKWESAVIKLEGDRFKYRVYDFDFLPNSKQILLFSQDEKIVRIIQ